MNSTDNTHLSPPELPPRSRDQSTSRVPFTPSSASTRIPPLSADSPSQSTDTLAYATREETHTKEDDLSEQELRQLFDDEEIDRFLALFADYVSEVTVPASANTISTYDLKSDESLPPTEEDCNIVSPDVNEEWVEVNNSALSSPSKPSKRQPHSLAETVAVNYLLPQLPPARPKPERFTIGRLRLTIERLYLVVEPAYWPFLTRMISLSTWQDRRKSALFCALFWTLWVKNLLLSALFLRLLYSILRRRVFSYPTLAELRERRREVAKAEAFGSQVQTRLGRSSSSALMEAWRLFRVFSRPRKVKVKHKKAKDIQNISKERESLTEMSPSVEPVPEEELDDVTALDDTHESQEEQDLKRLGLIILTEIVDLHERIRNVFLWRHPSTSRFYTTLLISLLVFVFITPTSYLVKLGTFIMGFGFWHIVPVIAALPPSERGRLPPMLGDAPTDAEYAMELIAQRVARGENVRPPPRKPKKAGKVPAEQTGSSNPVENVQADEDDQGSLNARPGEVDWKKWGGKAASMKGWAEQSKRWIKRNEDHSNADDTLSLRKSTESVVDFTFLAQHNASPGTIAITNTELLFTPIHSSRPKIRINIEDIRGVKKTGAMKGLLVRWESTVDGDRKMSEERFLWVGGRDEVFARLVGWGGRRWHKV
ncbi:hypothetical protein BD410DRAFT_781185 [Rickenella mellea]|uniref:Uncharacterized protein n=1 Tax=Rickenella mellea TaxID=50990 RepID=A0A4Y7QM01_9AGAM|nr:hypothetical protein BD410DRAFT_781185 [Rickenella mellea]